MNDPKRPRRRLSIRRHQLLGLLFIVLPADLIAVTLQPVAVGLIWEFERLAVVDSRIVSVETDSTGELYLLTNETFGPYGKTGKVYKLAPD